MTDLALETRSVRGQRLECPDRVLPGVVFCVGELEKLSRADLDRSAQQTAAREKESTARLIAHLAEIKSRGNLAIEYGYSDLFDYCRRRLNLGRGAVWRRLQVASVCRRFPQILVVRS